MTELLKKIPSWWIVAIVVAFMGTASFLGVRMFNAYTDSVRDEAIQECNTVQLEEDLAFQMRRAEDLENQLQAVQLQLSERVVEIERVEVFKDRIVEKIREIEVEVVKEPDGALREEISPTTRVFLQELKGLDDE